MLLTNPYYSSLYTYIKSMNEWFAGNKNNCEYKCLDKKIDNFVFFTCFDLEVNITLECNFILRELKYEGVLKFDYNIKTNEVCVNSVPYISYGNVKIPIFTSDIAQIIVDKLKNYISNYEIKLSFSNPIILLAEDEKAKDIIPSLAQTKNHILLTQVLETIEKEKKQIMDETIRYKKQQEQLQRSREKSIAKKRKILGIDPKEFISEEDFQTNLTSKLLELWNKKAKNIRRHLIANEKKYRAMMLNNDPSFNLIEHKYDFEFLLRVYLLSLLKEKGVKNIDEYLDLYGEKFTRNKYLNFIEIIKRNSGDIKDLMKVWLYFYNYRPNIEEIKPAMIDRAIELLLDADIHSKNGVVSEFNYYTDTDIRKARLPRDELRKIYQKENHVFTGFEIYEMFLRDDFEFENIGLGYKNAKYHPAFKDVYLKYKEQRSKVKGDYFKVCLYMKMKNIRAHALDIIVQIARLREQLNCYEYLLKNPTKAVLNFYKESKSWGSLIQIPYWRRLSCNPNHFADNYNLFMIKPGVKNFIIDIDDVISFVDEYNFHAGKSENKILKSMLIKKTWGYKASSHSMIMIPDSLNNEMVEEIVTFAFIGGSSEIYFICESFEKERLIKRTILKEAISYFNDNERSISSCYVIIDPTYYESFMVDTPNNKNLWERYGYDSDYAYRTKDILGFDIKISLALPYAISGFDCCYPSECGGLFLDHWILDELLFGGYIGETVFPEIMNDYLRDISEETELRLKLKKHDTIF